MSFCCKIVVIILYGGTFAFLSKCEKMIKLEHVSKTYTIKHISPVHAIKDVSISIPRTGMIFFVGKSGCGKSTLLNLIGGLDQPTEGSIIINHQDISKISRKDLDLYRLKDVGFIFQDLNLIETLSIKDNIALSLELSGVHCDRQKIEEALKTVDLENYSNRMPNTLSGGERQRVAIARALIKSPQIILADEPTGSLDSETAKQIFSLLKQLSMSNLVIIVSHDKEYADAYGNRVIELKDGRIVNDSCPDCDESIIENNDNIYFENKPLRSSLPIKRALQLSSHYIKLKKFKLIITLLLSLSTFILFGLFDSLGNYNIVNNTMDSIYDYHNAHIFIQNVYKPNDNLESTKPLLMSFEEMENLQDEYPNLYMIPILYNYKYNFVDTLFDQTDIDFNRYILEVKGGVSVTPDMLDILGYDLLYGHQPLHENQVLISLHTFELYQRYGYKNQDDQRIDIITYEDIYGLHLIDYQSDYEIVGIIDTHLDLSKFEKLFNESELNTIERITLIYEYEGLIEGGLHQYLFINENIVINQELQYEMIFDTSLSNTYTTMTFQSSNNMINGFMLNKIARMTSSQKPESIIWIDDEFDELFSHQVILPTSAIFHSAVNTQEITTILNELIDQFVIDHYDEIQDEFEANELGSYASYIRFSSVNLYHPGYTISYFRHEAIKSFVSTHMEAYLSGEITISSFMTNYADIEVVGFFDDLTSDSYYQVYTSDEMYQSIVSSHHFYPLYGAVVILSRNYKEDKAFLTEITSQDQSIHFIGTNPVLTTAKIYNRVLSDFSSNLLYIGIALAIISTLQLFNLISSSITYKKKEIGIIRAIGGRISDVFKIFYGEALILGLISGVLAIILNLGIISIVNQYFFTKYGTPVKILIFGYRQIFIILLLLFASTTMSTIFPVYFYAKKHPIDTIRLS